MTKKISILGCGWLGFPLTKHLKNKSYPIKGSSRNKNKLELLDKNGIIPFELDIENQHREDYWEKFLTSDILVVDIPNKNIEAHSQFANLIRNSEIKQIIYTSSTSVYLPTEDPVEESSKLNIENPLVAIEKIYQNTGIPTTILRLSGLVGPDRHPGRFFRRRPEAALAKVPINLVHLEDVIRVMDWVLKQVLIDDVFNVTSLEHPLKFDFYSKAYQAYFEKPPQFKLSKDRSASKLISADKIASRSQLEFSLQKYYPELF
jgi:nucleoside-diphosphate-sugar epimerase